MVDGGRGPVSRRSLLRGAAGLGLGATAASVVGMPAIVRAQGARTVRLWTTQSAPAQVTVYRQLIRDFETANPGIKVALELVSDEDVFPKLTAAHAAGDPPEIVSNANNYVPAALFEKDRLEPLNDVAAAVGDFQPRSLEVYNESGVQYALSAAQTVISTMWIRADLFKAQGLEVPKHWDEYLAVCKALTKAGVYGTALPYGKGAYANRIVDMFLRQCGGDIVAPDGTVVFDNPGTVRALEFLKEVRPYAPPGANSYSFAETLNAFVSGAAAIGMYTGRTLTNIHAQNPSLKDKVQAARYVYPRDGQPYWVCSFDSFFVNKGPRVAVAEAKEFAKFFYKPEPYTAFILGAPAHNMPVVQKVASSPSYNNNAILQAHQADVRTMLEIGAQAWVNTKPTAKHKLITKMGDIYGSNVMSEVLQRVIVENAAPKAAAAWGQDRIAAIMKG
jgi:multiple sugar transport system substrate-binding protein